MKRSIGAVVLAVLIPACRPTYESRSLRRAFAFDQMELAGFRSISHSNGKFCEVFAKYAGSESALCAKANELGFQPSSEVHFFIPLNRSDERLRKMGWNPSLPLEQIKNPTFMALDTTDEPGFPESRGSAIISDGEIYFYFCGFEEKILRMVSSEAN